MLSKTPSFKSTGFKCQFILLKEFDELSTIIGWSRNALIMASLIHIIRMIEDKTYAHLPDSILNIHLLKPPSSIQKDTIVDRLKNETKFKLSCLRCTPFLFKKMTHFADEIGWSRNAFIVASMIHFIYIAESGEGAFIPPVAMLARTMIHGDKIPLQLSRANPEKS